MSGGAPSIGVSAPGRRRDALPAGGDEREPGTTRPRNPTPGAPAPSGIGTPPPPPGQRSPWLPGTDPRNFDRSFKGLSPEIRAAAALAPPDVADAAIRDAASGKVRKVRSGSMRQSILGQAMEFAVLMGLVGIEWVRAVLRGDVW